MGRAERWKRLLRRSERTLNRKTRGRRKKQIDNANGCGSLRPNGQQMKDKGLECISLVVLMRRDDDTLTLMMTTLREKAAVGTGLEQQWALGWSDSGPG